VHWNPRLAAWIVQMTRRKELNTGVASAWNDHGALEHAPEYPLLILTCTLRVAKNLCPPPYMQVITINNRLLNYP